METRVAHLWEGLGPALPTSLHLPLSPSPSSQYPKPMPHEDRAYFLGADKAQVHGLRGAIGSR